MGTKVAIVRTPEEAATMLGGISVGTLVKLLKAKGYAYTELKPGAAPWGRGRQLWGLTDSQIEAIVAGQSRRHARPEDGAEGTPRTVPGLKALGHDGKSRVRRRVKG